MKAIRVAEFLNRRVLVTRESAHDLRNALDQALAGSQVTLTIDFEGIEGVTPSFIDELLAMLVEKAGDRGIKLLISHPPTRLTAKFTAIGRSRGLSFEEEEDGSWLIAAHAG